MAKGENIYRRRDGRWEARYEKGRGPDGRIVYGFCYGKTYREAKQKAVERRAQLTAAPLQRPESRRTLAAWCAAWLESGKKRLKESTRVRYDTVVRLHILPLLGNCTPGGLTEETVGNFTDTLLAQGLSPKSVRDILVVLKAVLRYAAKQCPGTVPALEIGCPKEAKKEERVLTKEEQRRFVAFLLRDTDECKFATLLALCTGMRIGELCALRWENISLTERTVRVCATMQRIADLDPDSGRHTKVVITSPKSDTSVRTIPLPDFLVPLCRRMRPKRPSAFVVSGETDFVEPRTLQYRLARYTKACGLEGVHFHTLRHTFATRCVEAGFEVKSLSEILGHATTTITLDRYVHASLDLKRANMNKLRFAGF